MDKEFRENNYTTREKSKVVADLFATLSQGFNQEHDIKKDLKYDAELFHFRDEEIERD